MFTYFLPDYKSSLLGCLTTRPERVTWLPILPELPPELVPCRFGVGHFVAGLATFLTGVGGLGGSDTETFPGLVSLLGTSLTFT